MAVNQQQIKLELRAFIEENLSEETTEDGIDRFCDKIASIITTAIRSADVVIPTGAIQVQGTAVAQSNITPIILTNTIA